MFETQQQNEKSNLLLKWLFNCIVLIEMEVFMKNTNDTVYCYKYSSNIENLISKLNFGTYYREYMINYHNKNSFSIGVERLGYSSGRWYEATIEKNDDTYLIKGKLVVLPKSEDTKLSFLEKLKLVLLYIILAPLCIVVGLGMLISCIIKKIRKDPFATYNPEKRLDYFMINYLGCEKCKSLICFSEPDKIELEDFKKRVIEVYASDIHKEKIKNMFYLTEIIFGIFFLLN